MRKPKPLSGRSNWLLLAIVSLIFFLALAHAQAAQQQQQQKQQKQRQQQEQQAKEREQLQQQEVQQHQERLREVKEPRPSRSQTGKPLQIVMPNELHTGFVINEQALEVLEEIPGPIAVIAAMGPIHSGKSFFLNSLLGSEEERGFPVGFTVSPGSRGLSIYSSPLVVDRSTGLLLPHAAAAAADTAAADTTVRVLLLDSEGFGGPNVTRSYDQLLYAIASFLASHALQLLEDLTKDANLFSLRAHARSVRETPEQQQQQQQQQRGEESSSALLSLLSPCCLSWVVQDFDLEGLTAQQWFDRLLETNKWLTPPQAVQEDADKHLNKHTLRELFASVECVAFKAPTEKSSLLQRLDLLQKADQDESYAAAFEAFRMQLLKTAAANPKMKLAPQETLLSADGNPHQHIHNQQQQQQQQQQQVYMSGRDLAELTRFLVAAANANMFEDVHVFMNHFSTVRSAMAKNDLLLLFNRDLSRLTHRVLPLLPSEVAAAAAVLRGKSLQLWQQQVGAEVYVHRKEVDRQKEQLQKKIDDNIEKALQAANQLVGSFCEAACQAELSVQREGIEQQMKRLPLAPKELADYSAYQQQQSRTMVLQRLQSGSRDYSSVGACSEHLAMHFEAVQALYLDLYTANIRSITEHMQRAADRAVELLRQQLLQQPLDMLRPLSEFRALLLDWQQAAWTAFEADVASLRDVPELHSEVSADLAKRLRDVESLGMKAWTAKCKEVAAEVVSRWEMLFRHEVLTSLDSALPVEEEALALRIQHTKAKARQEFSRVYCAGSEPWTHVSALLEQKLHDLGAALEVANLEAIKTNCSRPLDKLKAELGDEAATYYLWPSFAAMAKVRAESLLLSSSAQIETAIRLSPALVNRVSVHWTQTELKELYQQQINNNFFNLVYTILGVGVMVLGASLSVFVSWRFLLLFFGGGVLALGLQNTISLLRAGFQCMILGLLRWLYTRLGLEASVTVVVVFISALSLFLYSKCYQSETKPLPATATTAAYQHQGFSSNQQHYTNPHAAAASSSAFSSPHDGLSQGLRPRMSEMPRNSTYKDEP
ncbi:hypothetical protein Efla_007766 [Eimeria flavescens]